MCRRLAETGSGALFFLAIGAMLLLLRPALGADTGVVTGFVITMLYVRRPITQAASGIPSLLQAQIAFRRIAGLTLPPEAAHYLERLDLAHKVRVENGTFSTTDLSTGQRKRLALIQAWLEGRPVLVFDEWAADQDPSFRRVFYTELLPELRAQGRTLIVISNDDRYFHIADRVLRLDAGRIVAEERPVQDQTP